MTRIPKEELDKIRNRYSEATKGPWLDIKCWSPEPHAHRVNAPHGHPVCWADDWPADPEDDRQSRTPEQVRKDVHFIAQARTDVPKLETSYREALDEIDRLQKEVERLSKQRAAHYLS